MKSNRTIFLSVLILALCHTAAAAVPGWLSPDNADAKYLIATERRWINSGCSRENLDKEIMAPGFLGTAPDGRRFKNSEEFDLDTSVRDTDCRLDEARVRLFRRDLAVVYGSERTTRVAKNGDRQPRCLVWTDTWLKRGKVWLIVAAQDTVLPCK